MRRNGFASFTLTISTLCLSLGFSSSSFCVSRICCTSAPCSWPPDSSAEV